MLEDRTTDVQHPSGRPGVDGVQTPQVGERAAAVDVPAPVAEMSRVERRSGTPIRCRCCGAITHNASDGVTRCTVCDSRIWNSRTRSIETVRPVPTLLTDYANWRDGAGAA
jgi:uncharacterized paraquat-inducible protein A